MAVRCCRYDGPRKKVRRNRQNEGRAPSSIKQILSLIDTSRNNRQVGLISKIKNS